MRRKVAVALVAVVAVIGGVAAGTWAAGWGDDGVVAPPGRPPLTSPPTTAGSDRPGTAPSPPPPSPVPAPTTAPRPPVQPEGAEVPADPPTTVPAVPPAPDAGRPGPVPPPPVTEPAPPAVLRPGAEGGDVQDLQQRLVSLGYWIDGSPDGVYGSTTAQAVMAFQKVTGLDRDGIAGPATREALAGARRPQARSGAGAGSVVEIDLERQVLLVVRDGEVVEAFNTSTGATGWRTPPGRFVVDRHIDGVRHAPLGELYRPKYFNGGIAVHGSPDIPGHPASHGCARVHDRVMDHLWSSGALDLGTPVWVY